MHIRVIRKEGSRQRHSLCNIWKALPCSVRFVGTTGVSDKDSTPPDDETDTVKMEQRPRFHSQSNSTSVALGKSMHQAQAYSRESLNSKVSLITRTLMSSQSTGHRLLSVKQLSRHLLDHPESVETAVKTGVINYILRARRKCPDSAFKSETNQCLSLLGYMPPLNGYGIRVLSLDGGGIRGIMALEILEELEAISGNRIANMFDYVIGVSTGAIIASLLTVVKLNMRECKEIYRQISAKLFSQDRFRGTTGLLFSHSYYDTALWVSVLREAIGETTMIETVDSPRLAFVSAVVNQPTVQPFLFRNYQFSPARHSSFPGSCKYKVWEAVQASGAAPGYFEEVKLGDFVHQDGGVLFNNPTSLGLHEAKLLWPDVPLQCIVSVGNGRPPPTFKVETKQTVAFSSLKEKVIKIVDSATDTEKVHRILSDILPGHYYRFNPYMAQQYSLDENNPKLLAQMTEDAKMYIRKNRPNMVIAVEQLLKPNSLPSRLSFWLSEQCRIMWG